MYQHLESGMKIQCLEPSMWNGQKGHTKKKCIVCSMEFSVIERTWFYFPWFQHSTYVEHQYWVQFIIESFTRGFRYLTKVKTNNCDFPIKESRIWFLICFCLIWAFCMLILVSSIFFSPLNPTTISHFGLVDRQLTQNNLPLKMQYWSPPLIKSKNSQIKIVARVFIYWAPHASYQCSFHLP